MKYISLFSGLGECTLALKKPNFDCVGFYENRAIYLDNLVNKFPNIPNYGNFRNINSFEGNIDLLVVNIPLHYIKPKFNVDILTDPHFQVFSYISQFIRLRKIPFTIIQVKSNLLRIPKVLRYFLHELLECELNELPYKYLDDFFIQHNNTAISWRKFSYESFNLPQRGDKLFIFIAHSEQSRYRDKSYRVLFDRSLSSEIPGKKQEDPYVQYSTPPYPETLGGDNTYYCFDISRGLSTVTINKVRGFLGHNQHCVVSKINKRLYLLTADDCDEIVGLPRGFSTGISDFKRGSICDAVWLVPCLQYIGNQLKNFLLRK